MMKQILIFLWLATSLSPMDEPGTHITRSSIKKECTPTEKTIRDLLGAPTFESDVESQDPQKSLSDSTRVKIAKAYSKAPIKVALIAATASLCTACITGSLVVLANLATSAPYW